MKYLIIYSMLTLIFIGCGSEKIDAEKATFEVRIAEVEPADTLVTMKDELSGSDLYLHPAVVIDQNDIIETDIGKMNDYYVVNIYLTEEGGKKISRATADNLGKKAAMLVNNKVVSSPVIRDTITGRRIMVNGNFDFEEAERIMSLIESSVKSK